MTTEQSSKQTETTSGPDLEGVIGAPLDEKLAGFNARLDEKLAGFKKEIMVEVRDMLETLTLSKKETAAATTTTATALAAEVGREASHSSTKQQRPREAGGIKRIYMIAGCCFDYVDFSFQCFVLNLENGEETTLTISPASDKDRVLVHWNFSVVALGSLIYMIGGRCLLDHCPDDGSESCSHFHPYVRYFDTREPEKGWKLGVPMLTARASPAAAVIDGKIYVVGGLLNQNNAGNDDVFGEFFDPKTNMWHPLTQPAGYQPTDYDFVHTQVPYVYPDGKKSILMNTLESKETLYEYLLDEQKWRIVVDKSFGKGKCVNQAAILDHILYTVCGGAKYPLFGFDLILKQWIPVNVKLRNVRVSILHQVTMSVFTSGSDKLCLVWHLLDRTGFEKYGKYRKVVCLELKVNKSYSESGILNLTATEESYHYFYVSSGSSRQIFLPM